jgi:uracil-DNA glycosylase
MIYDFRADKVDRSFRHFDWTPVSSKRMDMLRSLRDTCKDCVMCSLGRSEHTARGRSFDPHVFSSMNLSRYMVVGQNPGFNECLQDVPFVGDAGENFNKEISKHGLSRKDFYITNICKCHTENNRQPDAEEIKRCSAFFQMELYILMPKFIITLGAISFGHFCPNEIYAKALGKMTHSALVDKNVFAIYHPSPRNLAVEERKTKFERQIELLCKMIKFFKQKEQDGN